MIEIEDGSEREGEGRVTAVTGTCPAITIAVDGLSIQADALTRYIPATRGADCDQVRVGTKIKVSTATLSGGGLRARVIEIKGQRHFGEGEGRITSVSGACPDLRILLGSTPVDVSAATDFVGGTCADLAPGVSVHARGFRDDDATTNIASWIRFKARRVEGRSVVTAVTGTCPTLAITVGGRYLSPEPAPQADRAPRGLSPEPAPRGEASRAGERGPTALGPCDAGPPRTRARRPICPEDQVTFTDPVAPDPADEGAPAREPWVLPLLPRSSAPCSPERTSSAPR